MNPLEPPDSFYLQAAQGWLELGNRTEAAEELRQISPAYATHPDVLHVRWELQAAGRDWEAALETAATLVHCAPDELSGWIHRSYALHELKRTEEARDNLLLVVHTFADSATLRYNLACYECQLGRLTHARKWLKKAFAMGDAKAMKQAALNDPDLAPMHDEIRGM